MPSEIITHTERVQRQRVQDGCDAGEQWGNRLGRSPYRRMLLLPLYTPADLLRQDVTEFTLAQSANTSRTKTCEIEDLPHRLCGLMQEMKCEARIICVLEGVRAALAIPQPHITASAPFSEGSPSGCRDKSSGRKDSFPGSLALPTLAQQLEDTATPGRAPGPTTESMPVSYSFSAENLDELISMLLIEWGIDTQEPLNPAGTALFLLGAVKQLRGAAQLSELPVDLQQRPKKRRQMSFASAVIVNKIASGALPISSRSLSHDSSSIVSPETPTTAHVLDDGDTLEQSEERGHGVRGTISNNHVSTFACRLWAEQLMQISGVTDKVASAVIRRFRRPAALVSALQTAERRDNRCTEPIRGDACSPAGPSSVGDGSSGKKAKRQPRSSRRKINVANACLMAIVKEIADLEVPSAFTGTGLTGGAIAAPPRALRVGMARAEKICRLFHEHVDSRSIL
ncbi:conserved hypothetical protein [Neospora caninum Liverpool]|uniref:Uncharacterized protein n=1 Tax=Neospora caninum (strain Liverpool) TaxID=572307 RepID=F0VHH4_NEOCL|nr:conserved hypothetical protein [Neospora caninum Liverpool]CBZ53168.1 conserved hypothetical protein [Neospora caninum Liverpool]CEL67157.1 TPA: hypothetical protein BN1204_029560 [Neospora caninum Liverpool]|eukprot:XP_003883200.1 conserved hypothetical protein [Neospora caninum Liverpool]